MKIPLGLVNSRTSGKIQGFIEWERFSSVKIERRKMLFIDNLDQLSSDFLAKMVDKSGCDPAVSVSMYEIGTELGLDKEASRQVAEDIIGRHLAEIVSLSGTVRLTENGVEAAGKLGFSVSTPKSNAPGGIIAETVTVKGTDLELRLLSPEGVEGLRKLVADLLNSAPPEAQADVSGLLAHLGATAPKAGVAAELLLSILAVLDDGELRKIALGWMEKLG